MATFVEAIRACPDYIGSNGRNEEEIEMCEKALGVIFAADYRQYLAEIGLACFDGREITGICTSPRLNVAEVTRIEKEYNEGIPDNFYVVEEAGMDGIVIWQDCTGTVFQTAPNRRPRKIAGSLTEFFWRDAAK